jgi:deoxyribodipyrimidine photo-lyase
LRPEHSGDREDRQQGGESEALSILESFLNERGEGYSRGVSSPSSAWTSCSRLSPYLAFGHISVRRVAQRVAQRQEQMRAEKNARRLLKTDNEWLR